MHFPFTALVGQDRLKTALLLAAVDPAIGGVLVTGEKGTAKSTAARGLSQLLPPIRTVTGCPYNSPPESPHYGLLPAEPASLESTEVPVPFVDLPLGATEDRLLGTLDFERALSAGRRAFQPGLLAKANRGILYVDEVNLLPDHLVDLLLDAAASGVNVVQREGMEVTHPARFILVGTMNPEEGQLRPQLLDRFALMVEVSSPSEPEHRVEVVRRRMAFEAQPDSFVEQWRASQQRLEQQLAEARKRLCSVVVDEALLLRISRICCEVGVDGLRADIAMHRAVRALAALFGRDQANEEDVRQAAEFVLPHRRRRQPFESPGLDREQLEQLLSESQDTRQQDKQPSDPSPAQPSDENDPASAEGEPADDEPDEEAPDECPPGTVEDGRDEREEGHAEQQPDEDEDGEQDRDQEPESAPRLKTFKPGKSQPVRQLKINASDGVRRNQPGRRNRSATEATGHYVRAVPDQKPTDLAVDATIRSAAQRGTVDGRPAVRTSDLHQKQRCGQVGTLILFVVDASGSMAARRRMEAVKAATLSLLVDAYQRRDRVGVIAFRGPRAALLLAPTASVEQAQTALDHLPTGGRTPLADALRMAGQTVQQARRNQPDQLVLTVALTDGKANVPLADTQGDAWEQALQAASHLAQQNTAAIVLDTETSFVRLGRARQLADALAAEYRELDELSADTLTLAIRQRTGSHGSAVLQAEGQR